MILLKAQIRSFSHSTAEKPLLKAKCLPLMHEIYQGYLNILHFLFSGKIKNTTPCFPDWNTAEPETFTGIWPGMHGSPCGVNPMVISPCDLL